MPRLGAVTCQILELEFVHALLNDSEVEQVWVIQDEFSEEFNAKHGLRVETCTGTLALFETAWEKAKNNIS